MKKTFAHRVEAELASLLDAHGIRWQYEPHRFRLAEGKFVPDFYLTDAGIYVECAIAAERHVTRKNQTARETCERYGETVNVLSQRNFERFAAEYDSQTLRVDVDHRGEPGAAHRRSGGSQEPAGARRNASRLGRLRDQLGPIAPAKAQ